MDEVALDILFRTARSYKRFTPDPVSEATIQALYELLKWGPTSSNCCPGRFVFLASEAARQRLADVADEGNKAKIMSAPLIAIVAHDLDFNEKMPFLRPDSKTASNWWPTPEQRHFEALRSGSLEGAYLMLAARSLGLDCGPMGGFDHAAVDAEFFPGANIKSNFIVALGKGTEDHLPPRFPRFPFDEVCKVL